MAGPKANIKVGRDLMRRSGVEIDPPVPCDRYLGRGQDARQMPQSVFAKRMATTRPMPPEHGSKQHASASN
eukprot:7186139-Pyramimonas_sp.AAC.1